MKMLSSITLLILCQLVGEAVAHGLGLPIPGSVIGMVILFLGLCVKGDVPTDLDNAAKGLLTNLSLLFVPAGVGLIANLEVIRANILPISATLILSTTATLVITALSMRLLRPKSEHAKADAVKSERSGDAS